jgi:hypothetical protein
LFYISDRFNAQFRLDWVLGLFDKNLNKLWNGKTLNMN